jgi:uncharacterized membrane protein
MTRERETALLGLLGVLLAASIGLHVHHLLTGAQEFWIGVTLIMTLFCLGSSLLLLGAAGTVVFFVTGISLGLCFESLSIRTGFPFGPYYYTPLFGPGVFEVPLIIPLAWYVIVYLGYVMSNLLIERAPVVVSGAPNAIWLSLMGAGIVTAYDLAADPFMVRKIGAWVMLNPGDYFGEQLRGFGGWTLVSFLIALFARLIHRRIRIRPPAQPSVLAAAYPLLAYAVWWLFFSVAGYPRGTRVIALYAMGLPTLGALSGLLAWRRARAGEPRWTPEAL